MTLQVSFRAFVGVAVTGLVFMGAGMATHNLAVATVTLGWWGALFGAIMVGKVIN